MRCRPRNRVSAAHRVGGDGPFAGSELMWAVALASAAQRPHLLTAATLGRVTADEVAAIFRVGGETVADPERRAALWRDLATGLDRDYGGRAANLLAAAGKPRRPGRAARSARGLRRLLRSAGEEGAALREDLRAPRMARGGRSGVLGGDGRQRADAARAALGPGRAGSLGEVRRGDPDGLQAGRRAGRRSRPRCSTTCCGSSAGTIPTCSGARPATCVSRRATRGRAWY